MQLTSEKSCGQRSGSKRWKAWLKDEKLRDQAMTEMKSVTDPHAVPAVVRIFAQGNERDQVAAVHLLGQIDFPSSTQRCCGWPCSVRPLRSARPPPRRSSAASHAISLGG